jgi:hypothetical protein
LDTECTSSSTPGIVADAVAGVRFDGLRDMLQA